MDPVISPSGPSAECDFRCVLSTHGDSRRNHVLSEASYDTSRTHPLSRYSPHSYAPLDVPPSLSIAVDAHLLDQLYIPSSPLNSDDVRNYAHLHSLFPLAPTDALSPGQSPHSDPTSPIISPSSAYIVTSPISAGTTSLASPRFSEKPSFRNAPVLHPVSSPTAEVNAAPPLGTAALDHRMSEARSSRRQAEDGGVSLAGGPPGRAQVAGEMSVIDSADSSSDQTLPPPYSPY